MKKSLRTTCYLAVIALCAAMLAAGCSGGQKPAQAQMPVEVKAMTVIQRDTPVTYEFVGQVKAKDEVQIRARVSGNVVSKMVSGGDTVTAGQPLFQIDRRQYEAAVYSAQAQLAQAQALLSNTHMDVMRYQQLVESNAMARQTLDTQLATERQNAAAVDAYQAKLKQAQDDLSDTLIVAPFSGRIDVNDVSVGCFVSPGTTTLATISTVDPVYVQFSMSENEYLRFSQMKNGASPAEWGNMLKLRLSDGSEYPLTGRIEQVDRGMANDTGTLTMKASFGNPSKLLVPGMFARIVAEGEMRTGALLVPQRAVQQVLGKYFLSVLKNDSSAETRPVTMGPRVGNLWVVESGIAAGDRVVVDGFAKAQPGAQLKVTMIGLEDLQTTAKQ